MPRAICRCGQELSLPADGPERIVCPYCNAKVRIRRPAGGAGDGFIRFSCPCGRRLKVPAIDPPAHGQCPDCRRIVPVPARPGALPPGHPEAPTEDLAPADAALLDRWVRDHLARSPGSGPDDAATPPHVTIRSAGPIARSEVGLRICPRCKKPVHLGADVCRECGTPVPRG